MNSILKIILQVLAYAVGFAAACFLLIFLQGAIGTPFTVVFTVVLVLLGLIITGVLPSLYRKITGK